MPFAELLEQVEVAAENTKQKLYAYQEASARYQASKEDAQAKLDAETEAANTERERCVQDAQATYDATVQQTDAARTHAGQELEAARAELEGLRAQANSVLGDLLGDQNPRVRVSQ